ncbi:hypothetical protein ACKI1H_27230 [Pseudomonas sp. YH-1]|uniref:hypothetical protein n=1 Tax=Pseudomonas sp. YH-1 TaxID=3384787 RepID=UPI003F7F0C9C
MISIDYRTTPLTDINRAEIAGLVAQFLSGGGQIDIVPFGKSGETDELWNKRGREPSKARSGQTDAAHAKFQDNKREKRRLLARTVQYCAEQGMTVSATADAMDLDRATVRKIAAEHLISFPRKNKEIT